jgi:hypothetical protein
MHNLHSPNLYSTRHGTVLRCTCCDRIQVTFRHRVLLVEKADFESFRHTVHEAWTQLQQAADAGRCALRADADGGAVDIVLTDTSLKALKTLLDGAWRMYVLDEHLQAIASGDRGTAHDAPPGYAPDPQKGGS